MEGAAYLVDKYFWLLIAGVVYLIFAGIVGIIQLSANGHEKKKPLKKKR